MLFVVDASGFILSIAGLFLTDEEQAAIARSVRFLSTIRLDDRVLEPLAPHSIGRLQTVIFHSVRPFAVTV
jgi:hypothetical protein